MLIINEILTVMVDSKSTNDPVGDHSEDFELLVIYLQVFLVAIFPLFFRQLK